MAMLAEKKSKQKWSHDPRNKTWSNDTNRFGYQMLTKMGWKSGKGLGAKEDGGTNNIKVSKKNNSLGLGADKLNDNNWIAHQEDFNELLAKLNDVTDNGDNGSETAATKHETEKKAKNSKKRVFYKRFVKSKDLSGYSDKDMACILGQRSKSAPATPVGQSEDEDSEDSCASCPETSEPKRHLCGVATISTGQNIQEYFAKKMEDLKKRRIAGNNEIKYCDIQETNSSSKDGINSERGRETLSGKKKKKKHKKRKLENLELENVNVRLEPEIEGKETSSKKMKKRKTERNPNGSKDAEDGGEVRDEGEKKVKKRKRKENKEVSEEREIKLSDSHSYNNERKETKSKKKKKSKKCKK